MDTKSCFSIDASDLSDDARCKLPAQGQQPAPLAAIAMRMDVTTDLGCHPFECGTSVYAAGRAALALAQTQLAEAGIAQSELEQLRTANVSVMQAVVPFIFQFEKISEAKLFAKALDQRARLLGLEIRHDKASNSVVYREQVADASASEGLAVRVMPWPLQKLIRIDAVLGSSYLEGQCLTSLERWRNAYLENRYERIFKERVRRLFRLEGNVAFMPPGKHVYDQLSPLAAELLKTCVDGKDPLTFHRFCATSGMRDTEKKRTLKMLSEQILAASGIKISYQWKNAFLPPTLLTSKLVYPGDFHPDQENLSTYFCQQNWPVLLERLRCS
ncbi:MAG: hypothetical protein IPJ12_05920 [Betaproteobacteria bacterium]|nr:hypothetical protein [Betaproteobacteria bacterium]